MDGSKGCSFCQVTDTIAEGHFHSTEISNNQDRIRSQHHLVRTSIDSQALEIVPRLALDSSRHKLSSAAEYSNAVKWSDSDRCQLDIGREISGRYSHRNENEYKKSELLRFKTFENWPKEEIVESKALAKDGFYYTGPGDQVQCAFCGGKLGSWTQGDVVRIKHTRHFPHCPFINELPVGNVPLQL